MMQKRLECVMMDITPDANLDLLFKHLENSRFSEMTLGREKAYEPGVYLVTGGAIKLTATMEERRHTMEELAKLERVRNYLLDNGVYDLDGFNDYVDNEQGN